MGSLYGQFCPFVRFILVLQPVDFDGGAVYVGASDEEQTVGPDVTNRVKHRHLVNAWGKFFILNFYLFILNFLKVRFHALVHDSHSQWFVKIRVDVEEPLVALPFDLQGPASYDFPASGVKVNVPRPRFSVLTSVTSSPFSF